MPEDTRTEGRGGLAKPAARRWLRWLTAWHRDLGYFFTGTVLVYGLSGLALNHADQWNPNFVIVRREVRFQTPVVEVLANRATAQVALQHAGITDEYRGHDFPSPRKAKVFTNHGSVLISLETGHGEYEASCRRPILFHLNRLHLSPRSWWRIFSDVFSIALIAITLTGLFLARGNGSFARRGVWLVLAGIAAPALLLAFG